MKKFLQLITFSLLALVLVACGDQNNTEVESQPAESSVESAAESEVESEATEEEADADNEDAESVEDADDAESTTDTDDAESEDADQVVGEEEADETAVTFTMFVDGEETESYTANDVAGLSVLDAMESIEDLEFNFNEDEGVVDEIAGISNDYETGESWTYLLNGEFAELGVVSQTLSEGDEISWYFGTIDDIPVNIVPAE